MFIWYYLGILAIVVIMFFVNIPYSKGIFAEAHLMIIALMIIGVPVLIVLNKKIVINKINKSTDIEQIANILFDYSLSEELSNKCLNRIRDLGNDSIESMIVILNDKKNRERIEKNLIHSHLKILEGYLGNYKNKINKSKDIEQIANNDEKKLPDAGIVSQRPLDLPVIKPAHLNPHFSSLEEDQGESVATFREAVQFWNNDEIEKAVSKYTQALEIGLPLTWEASGHKCLGSCYLRKKQLMPAVAEFLKCLEMEQRTSGAVWESAIELCTVYSEAGLHDEANSLRSLATTANTRDLYYDGEAENKIRKMVRDSIGEKASKNQTFKGTNEEIEKDIISIKDKFSELPRRYQRQAMIAGPGAGKSIEIIKIICSNCDDVIKALSKGVDNGGHPINTTQVADGLKRLVGDARSDTGVVAIQLNSEGVSLYTEYLNQLDRIADICH